MKYLPRALVVALVSTGLASVGLAAGVSAAPRHRPCHKTFTLAMFDRAADWAYHSTGTPPKGTYGTLWRFARCQRRPSTEARARRLWGKEISDWRLRRHPPMNLAVASWYNDAGGTASGFHAFYGFATCGSGGGPCLSFGTRVEFCYPPGSGRCVVSTADDHGPYVPGRAFDLNQNTAQALGFGGVGTVAWRVVG
jgi:hypothetical protein